MTEPENIRSMSPPKYVAAHYDSEPQWVKVTTDLQQQLTALTTRIMVLETNTE